MRTALIGGIVALVALIVVIAITVIGRNSGPDVVSGAPGVFHGGPFVVRLDGPLWRARTLTDNDGAQDFALIERDLPLDVQVTGGADARVAELELRVDGRSRRVVMQRCPNGRCPAAARVRFVPPLRMLRPGHHQVELLVRDPTAAANSSDHGAHVSLSGFSVRYVRNVPATTEGRTISKLPGPAPPASGVAARVRRSALGVVSAARRSGVIDAALGSARLAVLQVGPLQAPGRRAGVTMLVALTPPRQNVSATVPAYVPIVDSGGGVRFLTQQVSMHVAVLRDALIDVDLSTGRVITFEPGPASRTSGWSPSKAPTPAGAADED
jgi:hypothetical protein